MGTGIHRTALGILGAISLTACHQAIKADVVGPAYPAREAGCEIAFLDRPPSAPYQLIARIEAHVERNFFFGGKATFKDQASKELRKEACLLGGDALFVENAIESSATEMSYVHAWAQVFRRQP